MRLAHFSDLHLLSLEGARPRDFLNKRSAGGLNLLLNRGRHYRAQVFEALVRDLNARGVEHVAFTGDVTNVALSAEFRSGRERFDRLAGGPANVTCVPGNHDAYVAESVGRFESVFGPYCEADPDWRWQDRDLWPIVRVRENVAVVGLSTSQPTGWIMAHGSVGGSQLGRLEAVLADPRLAGKFRVVLLHHPPAGRWARSRLRGLRDHRALVAVLGRAGAELVLHGHEHREIAETLAGPGGKAIPVRGIQSGSYDVARGPRKAHYRIYTIEPRGARGQITAEEARVWSRSEQRFVGA